MQTEYNVSMQPRWPFSLRVSAGPIAWGGGRSPRHALVGTSVIVVESETDGPVWTQVREPSPCRVLLCSTTDDGAGEEWLDRIFRPHDATIAWSDPVIDGLAARFPGIRSFTDGSLFLGLLTSIVGQSISIASAMSAQNRLAASFSEGIEIAGRRMMPLPDASMLADAPVEMIRASGVTWKRAEALKAIAVVAANGDLPVPGSLPGPEVIRALRDLPLVGPWTASSALLWGIGAPDAMPSGDVALLRAARSAYDDDGMSMKDLDALSDRWRPWRGIATRLLWTNLFGPAWQEDDHDLSDKSHTSGEDSA